MIYQFEIFRNLTFSEKKTFRFHLAYSFIEGIILGVLALNEYVFVKSMQGSEGLLSILFSFTVIVLLFSLFITEFLKRFPDKKKLLKIVAFVTRLPLFLLLLFPKDLATLTSNNIYHYYFLGIFFVFFLAQPIVLPIINLFLKNNYKHQNFGKLYSYSNMINKAALLVTTFSFGRLLDFDNYAFRYVYPLIGILGIVSIFLLSKIRVENYISKIRKSFLNSVRYSFGEFKKIMKENKAYRDFEIGFMFYGFAFMSSAVMIPLFYDKILELNYSSAAFYKNFYNILAILILPLFGKLLGKIDPRKFSIMTFFFMFLTILFTALTEYFPQSTEYLNINFFYFLVLANVFYGLFAAAMPLLWSIGSAYFCKTEEADTYQAIHLSLTGLRGLFAPFAGILIYKLSNFTITFSTGIISLILGIILMFYSMRKYR